MKVITRLNGGLGNQLFQLAFGISLAKHLSGELLLDTQGLEVLSRRRRASTRFLELDVFDGFKYLPPDVALPPSFELLRNSGESPLHSMLARIASARLGMCHIVERSNVPHQLSDFEKVPRECGLVYAEGYWATPVFAEDARPELQTLLTPTSPLPRRLRDIEAKMRHPESVGIHVRRGDFVTTARKKHWVVSEDYFWNAIKALDSDGRHLFFFSDDEAWCREKFSAVENARFISEEIGEKPAQHMLLLSKASNLVLSNSSFSWWAAWLSGLDGDRIIRPNRWTTGDNGLNIYPKSWSQMTAR